MFAKIPACVNDFPALQRITRVALEDFAANHVVYLELRSTPKRLLQSHSDPTHHHGGTCEKLPRLPMVCRFIVSVDRSQSLEDAQENVNLALAFLKWPGLIVAGVELCGNPTKQDFCNFELR
jgi:adenosine deaminase